jgi:hypothetical protein
MDLKIDAASVFRRPGGIYMPNNALGRLSGFDKGISKFVSVRELVLDAEKKCGQACNSSADNNGIT